MNVKQISTEDTYHLRKEVLREGGTFEEIKFLGDDEEQTFHLGGFNEKNLVSIASFYYSKHPEIDGDNHYQIRGMATHPDHRGKQFGSELLRVGFPLVKQNFCNLVWCNARVDALEFYHKLGFEKIGETFDIPNIGPHNIMFKMIH